MFSMMIVMTPQQKARYVTGKKCPSCGGDMGVYNKYCSKYCSEQQVIK